MWLAERWQKVAWAFGAVVLIGAAYTAAKSIAPAIEPAMPAHRGYVREEQAPTRALVDNMFVDSLQRRASSLKLERGGWNVQLQTQRDEKAKQLIQDQIARIDHDIQDIERQIAKLKTQ